MNYREKMREYLKELEIYGFKPNCYNKYEKYMSGDKRLWLMVAGCVKSIFIECEDEESNDDLDTLYDLIKDGLVEKVDDK